MKFTISNIILLKHLQAVQGVINSNSVLPILENFLFEVENGFLKISTTDLHTSMTTNVEINTQESGKIAIPSRILLDTLKALPEQPVEFSFDLEKNAIEISSSYGVYKLVGDNAEDFPRIPVIEDANSLKLSANAFLDAISKTLFAVSSDDLRLAMTGVYFELEPENINFVATDAHKLVLHTHKNIMIPNPGSFIVPKKALNLLKSTLGASDEVVDLQYNETNLFIAFENISLICRLIDQKFPDYRAVMPSNNPNSMSINRLDFLNSLRRISIYSNKSTYLVRVKLENNKVQISGEDLDFANAANEELTCEYTGDPIEIGFNAKFLVEMLNNLDSETVRLDLSVSSKPGLLFPSEQNEDAATSMLIMPMMLND